MLLVCGEAVIDLISDGSATGYQAHPGGSPANVAVGTARLGLPTRFLARLGTGQFGRLLREHLTASRVDLSLSVSTAAPATVAVIGLDTAGAASYEFYVEGTADWGWQAAELPDPLPEDVRALHVGSIASWRAPAAARITDLASRERHRGKVLISFDPNLRPSLVDDPTMTRSQIDRLIRVSHLVKVSAEDLAWLYPSEDPHLAAGRWAGDGPELVVVTDGANGAAGYRPGRPTRSVPAHAVELADTVGAGDAFTAGLLVALADLGRLTPGGPVRLADGELDSVLGSAALVAGLTCARPGADPPDRAARDVALAQLRARLD